MGSSEEGRHVKVRFYILSSLFAALTAGGAFIKIPIPYVPMTLQTFFVILAGSVLGPTFGALSQVLYLTIGLIGVPIFAHGGGPGYVFQPTFGYLAAYPIAAFVIGYLVWGKNRFQHEETPNFVHILLSNCLGIIIIFVLGVAVLYLNLNYIIAKPTSFSKAVWIGFIIFIPGSLIKIGLGSFLALKLIRIITI